MTEELKQTIKNGVERLPKEAQEVVNNFDWLKISEKIGKKNLLDEKEIDILQNEIGFVLIEVNGQDRLVSRIEDNVGTSKLEAIKINNDINQEIFKPLLAQMESSIKSNIKFLKPSWKQSVNFIVSGGDYSVFAEGSENKTEKSVSYREVI